MSPPISNTTSHSADATSGRRQRLVRIVDRNNAGGQQGDEDEQHQRRELRLDHGVRRALHEPATLVRELVAGEPVVGGLQRREHSEQHGEVGLRRGRTLGVDDANSTPPFSRCAASVSSSTTTIAANSQSITNVMNGSSKT